jgi:hypothetical protein
MLRVGGPITWEMFHEETNEWPHLVATVLTMGGPITWRVRGHLQMRTQRRSWNQPRARNQQQMWTHQSDGKQMPVWNYRQAWSPQKARSQLSACNLRHSLKQFQVSSQQQALATQAWQPVLNCMGKGSLCAGHCGMHTGGSMACESLAVVRGWSLRYEACLCPHGTSGPCVVCNASDSHVAQHGYVFIIDGNPETVVPLTRHVWDS